MSNSGYDSGYSTDEEFPNVEQQNPVQQSVQQPVQHSVQHSVQQPLPHFGVREQPNAPIPLPLNFDDPNTPERPIHKKNNPGSPDGRRKRRREAPAAPIRKNIKKTRKISSRGERKGPIPFKLKPGEPNDNWLNKLKKHPGGGPGGSGGSGGSGILTGGRRRKTRRRKTRRRKTRRRKTRRRKKSTRKKSTRKKRKKKRNN